MPDFSYQSLANMPAQQQQPLSLWDGLAGKQNSLMPSDLLAMMYSKQRQQQDPRLFMREINPGVTWGGRDKNAIQPNDFMQSQFLPPSPENI